MLRPQTTTWRKIIGSNINKLPMNNIKRKEKKINMRSHAKQRAKERLDLNLTKKVRKQIIKGIQNGRYLPTGIKKTNSRGMFIINDIGKDPFKVVYSKTSKDIVTVLYLNDNEKLILELQDKDEVSNN